MVRRSPCIVVVILCGLVATAALAQVKTSPSEILSASDRFDGQVVTINGTITNLQERVSARGNPYYTLDLSDGKQAVRVFSFGKARCNAGEATVEGRFEKVKHQRQYAFYNEVTATRITCR